MPLRRHRDVLDNVFAAYPRPNRRTSRMLQCQRKRQRQRQRRDVK